MSDEKPLKEVIEKFLSLYKMDKKFEEIDVLNAYKELMGNMINSKTEFIRFRKGKLDIKLSSAVLKQELSMNKSKIVSLINDKLGSKIVEQVVIK